VHTGRIGAMTVAATTPGGVVFSLVLAVVLGVASMRKPPLVQEYLWDFLCWSAAVSALLWIVPLSTTHHMLVTVAVVALVGVFVRHEARQRAALRAVYTERLQHRADMWGVLSAQLEKGVVLRGFLLSEVPGQAGMDLVRAARKWIEDWEAETNEVFRVFLKNDRAPEFDLAAGSGRSSLSPRERVLDFLDGKLAALRDIRRDYHGPWS
jgi:hypothetical protein